MTRTWTCQRVTGGEKCGMVNPARFQICQDCKKKRAPRKRPAHMAALDLSYEEYIALNGGEHCAICGRGPSATRRLDRDHCHRSGRARGLLCFSCNRALNDRVTPAWLRSAADYLERTAA